MWHDGGGRLLPSRAVLAAGLDHVRLSYVYLDRGDFDAYGSLLDKDVQVSRPDASRASGRDAVVGLHMKVAGPMVRHQIYEIIADGDCIVVAGHSAAIPSGSVGPNGPGAVASGIDFADFFTLSNEAMILAYRRFYFASPPIYPAIEEAKYD